MSEPDVTADSLIAEHGNQAYHAGLALVFLLLRTGGPETCRAASTATRELMMRGYHKYPKAPSSPQEPAT